MKAECEKRKKRVWNIDFWGNSFVNGCRVAFTWAMLTGAWLLGLGAPIAYAATTDNGWLLLWCIPIAMIMGGVTNFVSRKDWLGL
jgi:hypothetical protein